MLQLNLTAEEFTVLSGTSILGFMVATLDNRAFQKQPDVQARLIVLSDAAHSLAGKMKEATIQVATQQRGFERN